LLKRQESRILIWMGILSFMQSWLFKFRGGLGISELKRLEASVVGSACLGYDDKEFAKLLQAGREVREAMPGRLWGPPLFHGALQEERCEDRLGFALLIIIDWCDYSKVDPVMLKVVANTLKECAPDELYQSFRTDILDTFSRKFSDPAEFRAWFDEFSMYQRSRPDDAHSDSQ